MSAPPPLPYELKIGKSKAVNQLIVMLILFSVGCDAYFDQRPYLHYLHLQDQVLGICLMALCALGTLFAIRDVFSSRSIYIITAEGIEQESKKPLIRWQDVAKLEFHNTKNSPASDVIAIFLKDPASYYEKISPRALKQAIEDTNSPDAPVFISLALVNAEPSAFMEWLEYYRSKHVR